ncbi:DNA-3-methyladenine glycosidase [Devosia yakushimensis]|uniref:DNA-3-methyladenine glycosylase II n=1 Tax=Devosia yakushimensis TaxID=470028 RepID=A0ABQ5UK27_9HYPH|nr:DNA-3-methyladenine glycosylase 2 family protein [Devosia yakushimensis]GLQ11712.1 DNA-3-methyladenine glycosidase [Devosia yakushimensis]
MSSSPRIDSVAAIAVHLDHLVGIDPRLAAIWTAVGEVRPRIDAAGFPGIARIVCGQLLSVASAAAIWSRYQGVAGALDPAAFLGIGEAEIRAVGFSGGKYRTLRVIAEAVTSGALDFSHLETLPARDAVAYLTAHKGIGPWTAEVYLMFCAGHPDIFPAGDLALRKAVQDGLGLDSLPQIAELAEAALQWAPHRSAAALLFWRYYAVCRNREGVLS